jgi:hypothetical protein
MRLSEKIGFVLEHLIALELEDRGVEVQRSERPTNECVKSDLTWSHGVKDFVAFITHSRTQGMTNRKFYRTFEELAERRVLHSGAICVEVALRRDSVRTPGQYSLIFDALFDATLSVFDKTNEALFIAFVKTYPSTRVSLDASRSHRSSGPLSVLSSVTKLVDAILLVGRVQNKAITDYWKRESSVIRGLVRYDPSVATSPKLGMKMLSLVPKLYDMIASIAKGRWAFEGSANEASHKFHAMLFAGVARLGLASDTKTIITFDTNATAAAKMCLKLGIKLGPKWATQFLTTSGAKDLYQMIMDRSVTNATYAKASSDLFAIRTSKDLSTLFIREYKSATPRCDCLDLAIHAAGTSQNELSTLLIERLGVEIAQRNPVWFIVAKDEQADAMWPSITKTLSAIAEELWQRSDGRLAIPSKEEWIKERFATYFAHRGVNHHLAILEMPGEVVANSRKSILPRLAGLPSRYSMYVEADVYIRRPGGKQLFVKSISTPEARHHKHKEFSGKLRAIRYVLGESSIQTDDTEFLCVIDGAWTDDQIGMLAASGWSVCDWDHLHELIHED